MLRQRPGFSLVEMTIVLVIFALAMAISVPRLTQARTTSNVNAARQRVASLISTARAAAIRRGATAHFRRNNDNIWVTVEQGGVQTRITPVVSLRNQFSVNLDMGGGGGNRDTIVYSPRGIATNLTGTVIYTVRRDGLRDSVCVSRVGAVERRGCGL